MIFYPPLLAFSPSFFTLLLSLLLKLAPNCTSSYFQYFLIYLSPFPPFFFFFLSLFLSLIPFYFHPPSLPPSVSLSLSPFPSLSLSLSLSHIVSHGAHTGWLPASCSAVWCVESVRVGDLPSSWTPHLLHPTITKPFTTQSLHNHHTITTPFATQSKHHHHTIYYTISSQLPPHSTQ